MGLLHILSRVRLQAYRFDSLTFCPFRAPGSADGFAAAREMQRPNHRDLTAGLPGRHQVLLARLAQQIPEEGEELARTVNIASEWRVSLFTVYLLQTKFTVVFHGHFCRAWICFWFAQNFMTHRDKENVGLWWRSHFISVLWTPPWPRCYFKSRLPIWRSWKRLRRFLLSRQTGSFQLHWRPWSLSIALFLWFHMSYLFSLQRNRHAPHFRYHPKSEAKESLKLTCSHIMSHLDEYIDVESKRPSTRFHMMSVMESTCSTSASRNCSPTSSASKMY